MTPLAKLWVSLQSTGKAVASPVIGCALPSTAWIRLHSAQLSMVWYPRPWHPPSLAVARNGPTVFGLRGKATTDLEVASVGVMRVVHGGVEGGGVKGGGEGCTPQWSSVHTNRWS